MFRDMKQQVQFAFNLAQYAGNPSSLLTLTRMALAAAGMLASEAPDLDRLHATARRTLATLRADLLGYERASLTAAFSRDWDERRLAVRDLVPFFVHPLARLVDDRKLVERLVACHYIAVRERGPAWGIPAIADEFGVGRERAHRASMLVDQRARQLEDVALQNLEHALVREVAHA